MVRCWNTGICFVGSLIISSGSYSQPLKPLPPPADNFSKAFLHVYQDYPSYFESLKGKEIRVGETVNYSCRKSIPGCRSGLIEEGKGATCVFDFGSYNTSFDAEAAMLKLSTKVATALSKRAMVRYIDSTNDRFIMKRTAIAEIKDDGFFGYNILIDVVTKAALPGEFGVRLSIIGGEGTFYRFIQKNEPMRSQFFQRSFKKIQAQFDESPSYSCVEQLPGYNCSSVDSSNKAQLLMEKPVTDLPDAKTEFECLTTSIRAMLGESYLYYFLAGNGQSVRKVVFIHAKDHDLDDRRSISASLEKNGEEGYVLKVLMYHP